MNNIAFRDKISLLARHQSKREVEFKHSLELSAIHDVSYDEDDGINEISGNSGKYYSKGTFNSKIFFFAFIDNEGNCCLCGNWTDVVLLGDDYLCTTCFFAGNKIIFTLFNITKMYLYIDNNS